MKQRKILKNSKGITLIALVITIIVLLILAAISIATLTGENGILTQANKAKTETDEKGALEEVQLEVMGSFDNNGNYSSSLAKTNLENNLKATVADKGNGKLKVEYKGYTFNVDINGDVKIKSNIDYSKLKVGDYVDYHPDDVETAYDKFGETYSGYANGNIGQNDSLGWRILNINEDEDTIELISDKPTSTTVLFKGARGYNNGVALLNDYCKTMYSNKSKEAVARSLNIEDIQDKMRVNEATGKKAYESYSSGTGTVYKTGTYPYSSNKWYPLQWKQDNGIEGESKPKNPESSDIISYASEDNAKAQETSGDLTVTQTYWYLGSSDMSSNFESADTRDITKANSMYYELLCNNGSSDYWLASRYVNTYSSSYADFGLHFVGGGDVNGIIMFYSDSRASYGNGRCVLPVVSLPSNVIDLNTDYVSVGKWNLNS